MRFFDTNHLILYFVVSLVVFLAVVALTDIAQRSHTLRHNFPILAWIPYLLEGQREKIQQYFIEMPRTARPFNLRQRQWIYRSAKGASESGCWLSSGEGALSEHHISAPCDRVFEIGTALFGIRDLEANFSLERFQKVLPKAKITEAIAQIRNIRRDEDCHSPNRFKEFHDVPTMFAWVDMLQRESKKPIGVKFCLGDRQFARDLADNLLRERGVRDHVRVAQPDGKSVSLAELWSYPAEKNANA